MLHLVAMQRTREQLAEMSHGELVERVLEAQDMLRQGLAVRDSLHEVLNNLLKIKEEEVMYYAAQDSRQLDVAELECKRAWAAARHAVSDPYGLMITMKETAVEEKV